MHVLKALLTVFSFLVKAVVFCVGGFFSAILFVLRNAPQQSDELDAVEQAEADAAEGIENSRMEVCHYRNKNAGDYW